MSEISDEKSNTQSILHKVDIIVGMIKMKK